MRQRTARTGLCALAVSLAVGAATLTPAHAATPAHPATAATKDGHEATRDALRRWVEEGGMPGVAAMVRDGRETWFGSAGYADTDTGRKRSPEDHFRAASITKMFIATVLLQLEAEGRLSLDDSVETWLPGVVRGNGTDGAEITLRSLLNHTSGLYNYTEDPDFQVNASGSGFPEHRYDTYAPEDLVAVAMKHTHSAPGGEPSYSNTNYVLAGMVIEKVTGHSYAQEAKRRIIKPLKLRETFFPGTGPKVPKPHPVAYSTLHDDSPDAPVHDATEQNMSWLGAAGELISTAGDLNRFDRALMRGRLLPRPQLGEMLNTVPSDGGIRYGLGVEVAKLSCGVTVVGKTGRTNGSLSAVVGTEDGTHQLVFNANGDWLPDSSRYFDVIEAEFCGRAVTDR
ncbi:beta-lactamase [Streptomyces himastatinicus ATCC 53653]|uniref:Beta-lactamase n=1 Tax=Streptomyces himastatinicus ATCC 53653 TaxID=457427 RepID=D9WQ26_9ACTN|nr:serine hydrolase domain-containing protein [Streptomyces himastatinicus]EFL25986.1 beta-lactamase [Streptomyces himastatinicus ATCC 53653]